MTASSAVSFREAVNPTEYRQELGKAVRGLEKVSKATQTDTLLFLSQMQRDVRRTISDLPNGPSRELYEEALTNLQGAYADFQKRLDVALAAGQDSAYMIGAGMALDPLGDSLGDAALGISRQLTGAQAVFLTNFRADLVAGITQDVARRVGLEVGGVLAGAKTPGDAAKAIGRTLKSSSTFGSVAARARAIVVTEVGRASAVGTQYAQEQLARAIDSDPGIDVTVRKRWINSHLPGARASHLAAERQYHPDGNIGPIPIDEAYSVAGINAMYPRDPSLPARETVHCRCHSITIIPELMDPAKQPGPSVGEIKKEEEKQKRRLRADEVARLRRAADDAAAAKAPKRAKLPSWDELGVSMPRDPARRALLEGAMRTLDGIDEPLRSALIKGARRMDSVKIKVATKSTKSVQTLGSVKAWGASKVPGRMDRMELMLHLSRHNDEYLDWVTEHNEVALRTGFKGAEYDALIAREPTKFRLATQDEFSGTFIHELTHALDRLEGERKGKVTRRPAMGIEARRDLVEMVRNESYWGKPPTRAGTGADPRPRRLIFNYATTSEAEAIAEVTRMYYNGTPGFAGHKSFGWGDEWEVLTAQEWRAEFPDLAGWVEKHVVDAAKEHTP